MVEWVADELTLEWDRGFTIAPLTKKGELGPLALPDSPVFPSRLRAIRCRVESASVANVGRIATNWAISSRRYGKATPCGLVLN